MRLETNETSNLNVKRKRTKAEVITWEDLMSKQAKPIEEFPSYWVTPQAEIFREFYPKGSQTLAYRSVAINPNNNGFMRANFQKDDRTTAKTIHAIVYETFKGKPNSWVVFLDGDKTHCELSNLVSLEELVESYRQHHGEVETRKEPVSIDGEISWETLREQGGQPIEEFPSYWVTRKGEIFKETSTGCRPVPLNVNRYGFLRTNFKKDNRHTTKAIHSIVYEVFRGKSANMIIFLDGDKLNCELSNLVSLEELVEDYLEYQKMIA